MSSGKALVFRLVYATEGSKFMEQHPLASSMEVAEVTSASAPTNRMRCTFESLRELDRITAVFEGRIMERCETIARQKSQRLIDDKIIVQAVVEVMTQLGGELRTSISDESEHCE